MRKLCDGTSSCSSQVLDSHSGYDALGSLPEARVYIRVEADDVVCQCFIEMVMVIDQHFHYL